MLCNIKPVPFHESDKHIFAKIPGGGVFRTPGPPPPPPPLDPPMILNVFYMFYNLIYILNVLHLHLHFK